MNNLKKIGLTALAGSLVATSVAYAGELSVSGDASMRLQNQSDGYTGKTVKMGNSVYLAGSGETDSGLNVNVSFELDQGTPSGDGPFDSHKVSVGNDTLGTLTVHGHGGSNSAAALDTTAAGDLWDYSLGINTSTSAGRTKMPPQSSASGDNLAVYSLPTIVDGLSAAGSVQLANTTGSSSTAFGLTYAGIDGLSVSYGQGNSEGVTGAHGDQTIMKGSYVYGSFTLSVSNNDHEDSVAADNQETSSYAVSYSVTDELSFSYGEETIERATYATDIEVSGISASYTSGGMTLGVTQISADNVGHLEARDNDTWQIGLSFAF